MDRQVQRCAGHVQQALDGRCDGPDGVGDSGVATPTLESASGVHADDVAHLQHAITRNTVNDFLIDGRTGDGREGNLPGDSFEQRDRTGPRKNRFYRGVQFACGDTRPNPIGNGLVSLPHQEPRSTHARDFAWRTKIQHREDLVVDVRSGLLGTAADGLTDPLEDLVGRPETVDFPQK